MNPLSYIGRRVRVMAAVSADVFHIATHTYIHTYREHLVTDQPSQLHRYYGLHTYI